MNLTVESAYNSSIPKEAARLLLSKSNEKLEAYILKNPDGFDDPGLYGVTSVYWAIVSNNIEGLDLLLENDAEVNVVYNDGSSPLYWSLISSNDKLYKSLLNAGANPNICELHYKCEQPISQIITLSGDYEQSLSRFKFFFQNGVKVRSSDDRNSPLYRMIYLGRFDILEYLLVDQGFELTNEEALILKKYLLIKKSAYSRFHPMYNYMINVDALFNKI